MNKKRDRLRRTRTRSRWSRRTRRSSTRKPRENGAAESSRKTAETRENREKRKEKSLREEREQERRAQAMRERQEKEVMVQEEPAKKREECRKRIASEQRKQKLANPMFGDNDVSNRHMTWCKRSWWARIDDGSLQRKAQGLASSQKNSSRSNADAPVNALNRKFVVEEATAVKLKELVSKGEFLFFAINVDDYVAESLNDGIMRY